MSASVFETLSRGLINAESRNRNNGNRKKNKNGKERNKIFARCKSQAPACEAFIQTACINDPTCLAVVLPCCKEIEICEFTAFITCVNDAATQL